MIVQWTLLVGQRRHNGATREAEASLILIHKVYNGTNFFLRGDQRPTPVHPLCDHSDACTFLLPPLDHLWATDLLGEVCAAVLNMLKTSRRPWRGLNILCATIERPIKTTFRPPLCLQRRPGCLCGRTRGAQRSQPLCKGGITKENGKVREGIALLGSFSLCVRFRIQIPYLPHSLQKITPELSVIKIEVLLYIIHDAPRI